MSSIVRVPFRSVIEIKKTQVAFKSNIRWTKSIEQGINTKEWSDASEQRNGTKRAAYDNELFKSYLVHYHLHVYDNQ